MATYNPLLIKRQKLAEEQAELEREIALQQAEARSAALVRIRELMATFAITPAEVAPPAPKRKPGRPPGPAKGTGAARSGKSVRKRS
jgi:DNA-binding protein H-NS